MLFFQGILFGTGYTFLQYRKDRIPLKDQFALYANRASGYLKAITPPPCKWVAAAKYFSTGRRREFPAAPLWNAHWFSKPACIIERTRKA